jgi:hypothetical protein
MPWVKMLYFAHTVLGFSEAEFWKMTLRKYIALRDEYESANKPLEEQEVFADDLVF